MLIEELGMSPWFLVEIHAQKVKGNLVSQLTTDKIFLKSTAASESFVAQVVGMALVMMGFWILEKVADMAMHFSVSPLV